MLLVRLPINSFHVIVLSICDNKSFFLSNKSIIVTLTENQDLFMDYTADEVLLQLVLVLINKIVALK